MRRRAAALSLCALLSAGCGAARHHAPRKAAKPSALVQAQATHEYPSPPPKPQTATGPSSSAANAVRRFATAYINWDAQTVAARLRALAAASVGQARSAMQLAAAGTAADYELQRGGIANHGTVEAVAPLPGHAGQYVVVTLESTTATNTTAYHGLLPAWHVALAGVVELTPGHWVVRSWQPES